MREQEWWRQGVVYQIYPKSFQDSNNDGIGDLQGIRSRLGYIRSLGVDGIWISPVYCSPQVDNGYDISNYRQIDPMFGTNQDMEELISDAHALGLKIIMDMVANHTSDQHEWFQQSRLSRNNKYSDYYIWQDPAPDGGVPNNWGASFGGSAWTFDSQRGQYYLHYYAPEQPDLNWENPEVRNAIYDVMLFWSKKGVDGWRLDVITSISKDQTFADRPNHTNSSFVSSGQNNGPRMHEFIHELNEAVLAPDDLMSVGEAPDSSSKNVLDLVSPQRHELNMVFPFEHMKADVRLGGHGHFDIQPLDIVFLKRVMSDWQRVLIDGDGWSGLYFENHDRARIPSRWGDDKNYRYESATAFATVLYGMRGTPFVYQGEEIGMTNSEFTLQDYEDIETRHAYQKLVTQQHVMTKTEFVANAKKISRDHARTPMQWDGSNHAGFSQHRPWFTVNSSYSKINVRIDSQSKHSVSRYYRQLIEWRHSERLLVNGQYELLCPQNTSIFAYSRCDDAHSVIVVSNLTKNVVDLPSDVKSAITDHQLMCSNYEHHVSQLQPFEARIYD